MENELENRIVAWLEVNSHVSLGRLLKYTLDSGYSELEVKNVVLNCLLTGKIKVEDGLLCPLHPSDSPIVMVKDIIKKMLILMTTESKELSNGANQILRENLDFLTPDL